MLPGRAIRPFRMAAPARAILDLVDYGSDGVGDVRILP